MPLACTPAAPQAACADHARRATAALPHWASAPRRRSAGAVPGSPRAVGWQHGLVSVALFLLMLNDRRRQPTSSTRAHSVRAHCTHRWLGPCHAPYHALPEARPHCSSLLHGPWFCRCGRPLVKAHRGLGAQHPRRAQRHLMEQGLGECVVA